MSLRPPGMSDDDWIDRTCDRFEREWKAGRRPRIEEYLSDTVEPARSTLLVELVKLDWDYRRRSGESPSLDEYLARFPEHAQQLSASGLSGESAADDKTVTYRPTGKTLLDRFTLLEDVGRGAFGIVSRAHDNELDRIVAVKRPRPDRLDVLDVELFVREARAAAQLRHPNVVAVHEVVRDGDEVFIVSDFVEGLSLRDWLKGREVEPRTAAELCAGIADGLQHAHERGVIHRDLKPGNVLLDRRGVPHVTDFGLAKRVSGDATIAVAGKFLGTVPYTSPEQAEGRAHEVDERSDVFSLGVVLYEMLAGRKPFEGEDHVVIHKILTEEPRPPRQFRQGLPQDLETICLKALEKERGRRYPAAADMADDLRRFVRGEAVLARPVGALERGLRWTRRNFMTAASTGLACLSVPLLGYVALRPAHPTGGGRDLESSGLAAGTPAESPNLTEDPRRVRIETVFDGYPAPSEVVIVPLSGLDGTPQPAELRAIKVSPRQDIALRPGEYLIVAIIENVGFHEVYRYVPRRAETQAENFAHRSWTYDGEVVVLPSIVIFSDDFPGLNRFAGGTAVRIGHRELSGPEHVRNIPPFYLQSAEVTPRQFREIFDQASSSIRQQGYSDSQPLVNVTYHEALGFAEKIGMRLPEEWEFECAAVEESESGLGLRSGMAEWTSSWPNQSPFSSVPLDVMRRYHPHELRVVRGGYVDPTQGDQPDPVVRTRMRLPWPRQGKGSLLGFRCARGEKPRQQASDFSRPAIG